MPFRADSGEKFDQGGISKILALVGELTDLEFAQLMGKLNREQIRRSKSFRSNEETTQL